MDREDLIDALILTFVLGAIGGFVWTMVAIVNAYLNSLPQ